jgi:hypothetical protein
MDYKLYQSDFIKRNHQLFLNDCKHAYNKIKNLINTKDTTWNYDKYNIFSLTSGSLLFYNLYKELNYYIRDFIGNDRPLWIQSWLNYHNTDEILQEKLGKNKGYHFHHSPYHGYISIDPQNTITKFKNGLQIKNKIGQIYIGPGNQNKNIKKHDDFDHFVDIISLSSNPRITIGFDIDDTSSLNYPNINVLPLL